MNVPKKAPFSQVISEKNLDRQTNRLKDKQIGTQVDRQIDRFQAEQTQTIFHKEFIMSPGCGTLL